MPFKTFPPKRHPTKVKPDTGPLSNIIKETKRLGTMLCSIDHAADELGEAPRSEDMEESLDDLCKLHGLIWDQYDETTIVLQVAATPEPLPAA